MRQPVIDKLRYDPNASGLGYGGAEVGRMTQTHDEKMAELERRNAELLKALKEVVALSDRKTDVWDRAHAAIAKAETKFTC